MEISSSRPAQRHAQKDQSDVELPHELIRNSLYEFYSPKEQAHVQIVYFHGMEEGDSSQSYSETWRSHDRSTYWPMSLLAKRFSKARILSVSYDSSLRKTKSTGRLDLYRTAENLIQDLTSNVGVVPHYDCPIIMIGKDLGCLVIEAICVHAKHAKHDDQSYNRLLNNIKGLFFYGPPTLGFQFPTTFFGKMAEWLNLPLHVIKGLFVYSPRTIGGVQNMSTTFNGEMAQRLLWGDKQISRLIQVFFDLKKEKGWKIHGFIPADQTEGKAMVKEFPEATAIYGCDQLWSVHADMNTICTPEESTSVTYKYLADFIDSESKIGGNHKSDKGGLGRSPNKTGNNFWLWSVELGVLNSYLPY